MFSIEMGDRDADGLGRPVFAELSDGRSGARSVSAFAISGNRSGKPALKVSVIIGELPDSSRSRLRGDPRSSCGRSSINLKTSLSTKRRLVSGYEAVVQISTGTGANEAILRRCHAFLIELFHNVSGFFIKPQPPVERAHGVQPLSCRTLAAQGLNSMRSFIQARLFMKENERPSVYRDATREQFFVGISTDG